MPSFALLKKSTDLPEGGHIGRILEETNGRIFAEIYADRLIGWQHCIRARAHHWVRLDATHVEPYEVRVLKQGWRLNARGRAFFASRLDAFAIIPQELEK